MLTCWPVNLSQYRRSIGLTSSLLLVNTNIDHSPPTGEVLEECSAPGMLISQMQLVPIHPLHLCIEPLEFIEDLQITSATVSKLNPYFYQQPLKILPVAVFMASRTAQHGQCVAIRPCICIQQGLLATQIVFIAVLVSSWIDNW